MFDCMEDCIHLKACRRIQKIGRSKHLVVPRYCDEDCTAYQTGDANKIKKLAMVMREGRMNGNQPMLAIESQAKANRLQSDAIKLIEEITGEKWEFTCITY